MRVLMAHNRYLQRGGEDESTAVESAILRAEGDEVIALFEDNRRLDGMSRLRAAARTVWSTESYRRVRGLIRAHGPDVLHVQNFFPLLSPAIHHAARREGIPVVQSLRNYRLLCPSSLLFRDGHPCTSCVGRNVATPAVRHACYRNDRLATSAVVAMLGAHRAIGTWHRAVTLFIALSEFARDVFVDAGFDPSRVVTKPNCVHPDPGVGPGDGGYALFVGRLSHEKGVVTLLRAWNDIGIRLPLRIVGDGPLSQEVMLAASRSRGIQWLGRRNLSDVYALMARASVLVFPSEWYETFGRVAAEAFATGTPVIASDIGAIAELVDDGETGFRFAPGSPDALVAAVERFLAADRQRLPMRRSARHAFEARYSARANYARLRAIYDRARELSQAA